MKRHMREIRACKKPRIASSFLIAAVTAGLCLLIACEEFTPEKPATDGSADLGKSFDSCSDGRNADLHFPELSIGDLLGVDLSYANLGSVVPSSLLEIPLILLTRTDLTEADLSELDVGNGFQIFGAQPALATIAVATFVGDNAFDFSHIADPLEQFAYPAQVALLGASLRLKGISYARLVSELDFGRVRAKEIQNAMERFGDLNRHHPALPPPRPPQLGNDLDDNDGFRNWIGNIYSGSWSGRDFSFAVLSLAEFRGADLSGANFGASILSLADLSNADLSSADLSGANLAGACLAGTNLRGANLSLSHLRHVDLSGSDLTGADLSYADLDGTDLSGAVLAGASLAVANIWSLDLLRDVYRVRAVNLRGADLRGADLRGAFLNGADLRGADLSHTVLDDVRPVPERSEITGRLGAVEISLEGADLRGADLRNSYFIMRTIGADLRGIMVDGAELWFHGTEDMNLSGVDFGGGSILGSLIGANLSGANLTGVKQLTRLMAGANLSNADLSRLNLRGANFTDANLQNASLAHANLDGANFKNANLDGADLSGTDLSNIVGCDLTGILPCNSPD